MANRLGVKCRCANESRDKQMVFLFHEFDNEARGVITKVIGADFWAAGHVHDGLVYERFFSMYIQLLGYNLWGVRIAGRTIRREYLDVVMEAVNNLPMVPESRVMLNIMDRNAEGKKVKMQKAWKLFKKLEKKNNVDNFLAFLNANTGLLSQEALARMMDIFFAGVGFLYHQF